MLSPEPAPARAGPHVWWGVAWRAALYAVLATPLALGRRHLSGDSYEYLTLARRVADGCGYTLLGIPEVYRQPGYPYLVAAVSPIAPDLEVAGHLVALLLGILAIPATYWAARPLLPRSTALLATTLLAVNAYFVDAGADALTETGAALFGILALGSLWRATATAALARGVWSALGFGVSAAAAYLFRSESFLFFAGGLAWIAWLGRARGALTAARVAAAMLGFVVIAAPYWSTLARTMGHPSLGGNGVNLIWYQSDRAARPPGTLDPAWAPDPFDPRWPDRTHPARFRAGRYVVRNLPELAARYARNAVSFVAPLAAVLFFGLGLPLLYLGGRAVRRRLGGARFAVVVTAFVPIAVLPFRDGTERLLEPYLPAAAILMAAGLVDLVARWPGAAGRRRGVIALAVAAVALGPLVKFGRHLGREEDWMRARYRGVGAAIHALAAPGEHPVIMADSLMPGFHAGADTVATPETTDLAALLAQMDRFGARYLVVTRLRPPRPLRVAALATPGSHTGLEYLVTLPGEVDLYRRIARR